MARSNRQDLYLSVNGDVRGLQAAAKAGRSVLNELGSTAANVLEVVERDFQKIGANGPPAGLKEAERAYTDAFRRIGNVAREAAKAPTDQAALQILDANATRDAAEAASRKAVALRMVAEAATRADTAQQGQNAAVRAYAVAAATAALEAEAETRALLEQAKILGLVETEIGSVITAQNKGRVVSGQARIGYQQLSYQLGDISTQYASGASASIIFAQQSAQVIQAIQLISGEAKGLMGLLAGPWGIAFTAALVAVTPFVGKLFEESEASKEARKATEEHAEAIEELGRVKRSELLTSEEKLRNDFKEIETERLKALTIRQTTQARLEDARASLSALTQPGVASERGIGVAQKAARDQIASLETQLKGNEAAIAKLTRDADAAGRVYQKAIVDAQRTPEGQIRRRFDSARADAARGDASTYARRIADLNRAEDAEIKSLQEATKLRNQSNQNNRQFGREIGVADATRIVAGIGGRVTSGLRSTERQSQLYADKLAGRHDGPVAKPGTSAHERGGAIDVAFGPGISAASIKKAFADEGVALRKILREPGQRVFHVEFGKAGPSAATTARRQEAEADRRTQDADAYVSLLAQAKDQQLQLERGRITSISALADLDVEAVQREQADRDRAVQKGVELDRWTQAQADAVKTINAANAESEIALIRERERSGLITRRADLERDALDDQAALLRLQGDLAETAGDRRAIARRLLQIEREQVEVALRAQIATERDPDRRAGLQRRLDQVPQEFELRERSMERQNADPLQAYGQRLVDATSDTNEALKSIAADGFGALEDASSRAAAQTVTDLLKIRGVAGTVINGVIQDLIRLAIQKAIVNAVGKSFFGLADGGLVPGFADGGIPGFAGGGIPFVDDGIIRGPGSGRSDSILALVNGRRPIMVSNGEGIVNERAVREYWPIIDAMNKGQFPRFAEGGLVATPAMPRFPSIEAARRAMQAPAAVRPIIFDLRGALTTADVLAQMEQMAAQTSGQVIRDAAPAIVQAATTNTVAQLRRPAM